MKPVDWPRYMLARRLAGGRSGYYWQPSKRDREAGCALEPTPLGTDYGPARKRAQELNEGLDAWRAGKGGLPTMTRVGTVEWWLHIYRTKTRAWSKLRQRTQEEYARHLRIIIELPLTKPEGDRKSIGDLPVSAMTPAAVDRLYERLVAGDGPRLKPGRVRQAALEIDVMKIAWRAVQRLHPEAFPLGNPFEGLTREAKGSRTKKPATAAEAYALAKALREAGHPHLGACALICFEWHQRPENVLAGATTWTGYKPGEAVRIEHWKTRGARAEFLPDDERYFWMDLACDEAGPDGSLRRVLLYPEIEAYLADLKQLGMPIVLRPDGKPYRRRHAHAIVQEVRESSGLPDHLTLAACRHGGLTELGNAGVTEQEGMALSDHSTPAAFRLYVKRTEEQRRAGALKRRAWRERSSA